MRDNATGLWWSDIRGVSIWDNANSHCENLNYNDKTDWRLPTLEELQSAHNNGIKTIEPTNLVGNFNQSFWSSSLYPGSVWSGGAGVVNLYNGQINGLNKTFNNPYPAFVCVRNP